jgi:hypothetical protein
MLRPVERFFRAFGGSSDAVPHVSWATRVGGVALTMRTSAKRWARYEGMEFLAPVKRWMGA